MRSSAGVTAVLFASLVLTGCGSAVTPTSDKPAVSSSDASPTVVASATPTAVEPLPFDASGVLGGTGQPTLAAGDAGQVSVVQVGPLDTTRGTLVFAFRNNTSAGISHVDRTATARSGGKIVATGSSQGTTPAQLQPGEAGMAYIYFDNAAAIPADVQYEFQASTSRVDTSPYNTASLTVTEANLSGTSIVGGASNDTEAEVTGPYSVSIYCFDGDNLVSETGTFAEQMNEIPVGGTVTFSQDLFDEPCPSFVLGVAGYFS